MNRRSLNTILIVLGALGFIVLLFFIFNKKKTYAWNESYATGSSQPYGTLFLQKVLKETTTGKFLIRDRKSLSQVFEDEEFKKETAYVFIGESVFLSKADRKALQNFIYEGNNALIATKEIPDFVNEMYTHECANTVSLDDNHIQTSTLNFYHESFRQKYGYQYTYRIQSDDVEYNWRVFNDSLFCDSTKIVTPLGFVEPEHANFIRIRHGKGNLYLHSNPVVFTNFFIRQKQKMEYAAAVFSHMDTKNIVWEEFGKVQLLGDDEDGINSPLYYIMQQPSLKYAWWMIIAATLLYVLFAAKRTQRVIPILETKSNTSLEFVKMVSSLHFQNKNHMDMARKKMKYFFYFIRSKYGIHGQPYSEEMAVKLSEKSNVPLEDVKAVFKFYKLVDEGSAGVIDESRLTNFYHTIENFYKKCK